MEEKLFAIIGKLYIQNMELQNVIQQLQGTLADKDNKLAILANELKKRYDGISGQDESIK